jgi:hypothetical protein
LRFAGGEDGAGDEVISSCLTGGNKEKCTITLKRNIMSGDHLKDEGIFYEIILK